jgi:NTE family protein
MPDSTTPLTTAPGEDRLEDTLALCLSGGGYRAMLFHAGVLWYLNDAGYLPKLDRVSSVSGGSITAGVLAMNWKNLTFGTEGRAPQFIGQIVTPVRKMGSTSIDVDAVVKGALLPGTVSDRIVKHYRDILFHDLTLQDMPDRPRFVINATNVQTGSLFRFSKPYIADYRIGRVNAPRKLIAEAVAASSAFPPVLSPARLEFKESEWSDLVTDNCGKPPYNTKVVLTDGGVYDNMGIETAWKRCKRVLVSDAGGKYQPDPEPHADPLRHTMRVLDTIDNQVRSLRKRQVVSAFIDKDDEHSGTYWGMWTKPSEYPTFALAIDDGRARELAQTPTRLTALDDALQQRIINFGYGMAERAIRSYFDPAAFAPAAFPYPASGV